MIAFASCLLLAAAAAPTPARPGPPAPDRLAVQREVLPGDLEVLVLPIPGARTASLRYVVRAGSRADPPGKDGLAHVLEHVIVGGAGAGADGLIDSARALGATLNATTSRDATVFELDAPVEAFEGLAERYLKAVTSPAFEAATVERELKVVGREADLSGSQVGEYFEEVLFRSQAPLGTTIGASSSRNGLTRADLVEFYRREYATSATTVVVTGAVTAAAAHDLLERALLLPPALPEERAGWMRTAPALPISEKTRAPVTAAVTAYLVEPSDRELCRAAAEVIQLRLLRDLELRRPLLSAVTAECISVHGLDFLVAFGFSPTSDVEGLPAIVDQAFQGAGTRPPVEAEQRILVTRDLRRRDRLAEAPTAAADLLAEAAARPRTEGPTTTEALSPLRLDPAALRAFARRTFTPDRRLLIFASPYEG